MEGVRFYWIIIYEVKPECQLAINQFVQLVRNQWNLPIKVFYYNNEAVVGKTAEYSLISDGILIYYTLPGYLEINKYTERSGGMIITRIRMLSLKGKLPKDLQPEFVSAIVWLLNRTPIYIAFENKWLILQEEVRREFALIALKINLVNVRLYGSLAYCRIEKQIQLDKINLRVEVGFLVGYLVSNIYKIWFLYSGKVRYIRDTVIDEARKYSPDYEKSQPILLLLVRELEEITPDEVV